MNIVELRLSDDAAGEMYNALVQRKIDILDELDAINFNLDALRAMRSTKHETWVLSEHDPDKGYMVSDEGGVWSCTCPAWEFGTGIDEFGHCKHIHKVQSERTS